MKPEELLAQALLSIEPPKIEGGSKVRQDWLGLCIEILQFLISHNYDHTTFIERMNQ